MLHHLETMHTVIMAIQVLGMIIPLEDIGTINNSVFNQITYANSYLLHQFF